VSSGLMLASLGLGIETVTAPVLFYLVTSVVPTAAFSLLAGMTDRTRLQAPVAAAIEADGEAMPAYMAFGIRAPDPYGTEDEVGAAIPAAMAFLGLMFVCCVLLVTGLPPLPGFVAKFSLLSAVLGPAPAAGGRTAGWVLAVAVLATGLVGIVALTRRGMRLFWSSTERRTPRLHVTEAAPVAFLVLVCLGLTAASAPVMRFLEATARSLHDPDTYVRTVLASTPSDHAAGETAESQHDDPAGGAP